MRTLILTLAVVLLAAPVWADVEIKLEKLGDGVIQISYDATGEGQLVRAFALNVAATDGNIIDINDYSIGDDNGGYGIFPGKFAGNIAVNPTTGLVDSWVGNPNAYTPVAPAGDPDALGDIPGPGITIEMGSLYETAAPLTEGVLCTITVDVDVTEVCVTGNAIRGNVVLEDASEATMNPAEVCVQGPFWDDGNLCDFPSDNQAAYDDWVTFEKPLCWCYIKQCHGDADGKAQGTTIFGLKHVDTDDLGVLVAAWQVKEEPKGPGILSVEGGICADFDHAAQGTTIFGLKRVDTDDLGVLVEYWQVKEPPKGDGVPADCVPEGVAIVPE